MRRNVLLFVLAGLLIAPCLQSVSATEIKSKATDINLTGRVHTQFNTSSVEGELGSEFFMRRARITAGVKLSDFVSGKVQPDFAGGKLTLKDAYMKLAYSPNMAFRIGQFKRPFDLFELTSSTKFLVVERALKIRGVSGLRSYSSLTEKLGYSDRDIGVEAAFTSSDKKFGLTAAVTNGDGANNTPSKTDGSMSEKQYAARLKARPVEGKALTLGIGVSARPYETVSSDALWSTLAVDSDSTSSEYATAYSADLEWGDFKEGAHVQAAVVTGDNWAASTSAPPSFMAAQVIGSYRLPVENNARVEAVEPVFRLSWADPDTDTDDDGGILFTPGFQVFFVGRNKIAVNVDVFVPQHADEDTEYSIKVQSSVHF